MGLSAISLFSGAGGLDLAAKWAGIRTVCYVEWDRECQANIISRIRSHELDDAPIYSDVRSFDGKPWRGKVDIVFGGFPCQPHSQAASNRRRGGQTKEIYGLTVCESCKNVGLLFSSEKMSEELLPMVMPSRSWLGLRKQAIVQSQLQIRPVPLVEHFHARECSLLPTPRASDWRRIIFKKASVEKTLEREGMGDVALPYVLIWAGMEFTRWPAIYEWSMGWRQGWTVLDLDLKDAAMESIPTQPYRPSKKSSHSQE